MFKKVKNKTEQVFVQNSSLFFYSCFILFLGIEALPQIRQPVEVSISDTYAISDQLCRELNCNY